MEEFMQQERAILKTCTQIYALAYQLGAYTHSQYIQKDIFSCIMQNRIQLNKGNTCITKPHNFITNYITVRYDEHYKKAPKSCTFAARLVPQVLGSLIFF